MLGQTTKSLIILSGALPASYDTLKMITLANISELSTLNTETLISQILCEEKQKLNLNGDTTMLAKSSRLNCWDTQRTLAPTLRSNATNLQVQCMNPKCSKPGHSFEQCWTEGSGSYKGRWRGGRGRHPQPLGSSKDSAKVATSSDSKV